MALLRQSAQIRCSSPRRCRLRWRTATGFAAVAPPAAFQYPRRLTDAGSLTCRSPWPACGESAAFAAWSARLADELLHRGRRFGPFGAVSAGRLVDALLLRRGLHARLFIDDDVGENSGHKVLAPITVHPLLACMCG